MILLKRVLKNKTTKEERKPVMKTMRKILVTVLALMMVLALATTAFAQDVDSGANGAATITVNNASKGETYKVYKLFDATVTGEEAGSIAYSGEIPADLSAFFTEDTAGNIFLAEGVNDADLFTALKAWTEANADAFVIDAVSDGSVLVFRNLEYGYYVVTSTQGNGAAITVTSTNPNAEIIDKNTTTPITGLTKTADGLDYSVGDTITYTVSFATAAYDGVDQIVSYTISDTLPNFLSDVTVQSIRIDGTDYLVDGAVPQFDANKQVTIPWAEGGANLYANGAQVEMVYTAKLTALAAVDGAGNENKVTVSYKDTNNNVVDTPSTSVSVVETYAIALQKVDQSGDALAGATFQFPFYVQETPDADGAYIHAGTQAGEGLTNTLTTPNSGLIIVKGVKSGTYSITETEAPEGYNKLTAPVELTAVKTGETTTSNTFYLDEDGNVVATEVASGSTVLVEISDLAATSIVVVNKTGTVLPSTGGIGTTIFYVIGGILVLGAVVLLVTKKRMRTAE